jgi:hypothetical protein
MNGTNKPRISLALYHRGKLSLPPHRDELGLASFHWALLLTPKNAVKGTHMLDVTDAMQIDPVKHIDTNPDRNWIFRDKAENPLTNHQLVLIAMIGKLKSSAGDLHELVQLVRNDCRVPKKDTQGEHCQWWVREAVRFLQTKCLLDELDIDETFSECQRQATDRIDNTDIASKRAEVLSFTGKACDVFFGN